MFRHADATTEALDLGAEGSVAWWPEDVRRCALGQILVHVALDEARHAGNADILRGSSTGAPATRAR